MLVCRLYYYLALLRARALLEFDCCDLVVTRESCGFDQRARDDNFLVPAFSGPDSFKVYFDTAVGVF